AAREREHVDAIAGAARLHQQHGAFAAEPGARGERHAFFFGREHDIANFGVGAAALDEPRMAGIRDVADLPDIGALERAIKPLRPVDLRSRVHEGSPSAGFSPSSSLSSFTGTA